MPVALVTGGSRGLGKTIALSLGLRGYTVIVNCRTNIREAELVAEEAGHNSCAIRADVSDREQVRAMASEIARRYGRLDLVINNAGIAKDCLLAWQPENEWDMTIGTNLTGCFNIIRTMSPLMIESGEGHIVNISSHSGLRGKTGQSAYSASKAALLGLTLSAAKELGGSGIRVNAVMPGYLVTGMGLQAVKAVETARNSSVLKTLSSDREAADFIVFLAGTRNITGQVFSLDSRIG